MKQLVILSGKGGTGKTSISAAFAHLSSESPHTAGSVFVDADVDAANLSLLLKPDHSQANCFMGGSLAAIDRSHCTGCGACVEVCRYDAITPEKDFYPAFWVDPVACDGCAACSYACPQQAVRMVQQKEGDWFESSTAYGALFHAELLPGRENSGKLVTRIRQHARLWAEDHRSPAVIIDGPPGIGCPVISASAGVDLGLVVTEPGVSGEHDLQRVMATLSHFKIPAVVCINKTDIYPQGSEQIRNNAASEGIKVVGGIPFDENIPRALLEGMPITALYPDSPAARSIQKLWIEITGLLLGEESKNDDG